MTKKQLEAEIEMLKQRILALEMRPVYVPYQLQRHIPWNQPWYYGGTAAPNTQPITTTTGYLQVVEGPH